MKLTILASALAIVATTPASPTGYGGQCETQSQATKVVNEIIDVFGHVGNANATGQALPAKNFAEYYDSILALESRPMTGSGLTANKAEWIEGIVGRPAITDIQTLYTARAGCHKIVRYWQFNEVASAVYRVRGFNLITLNNRGQVSELDLEFNSIAWGWMMGSCLAILRRRLERTSTR